MKTQEILSIVALSLLGLCLLCGLVKMAMRGDSAKKNCDKACSMAVFAAVVLLAISQLIGETDGYCQIMSKDKGNWHGKKIGGCWTQPSGPCGPSVPPGPGPGRPCPDAKKCVGEDADYIRGCSGDGCPDTGTDLGEWWDKNCGPPWAEICYDCPPSPWNPSPTPSPSPSPSQ